MSTPESNTLVKTLANRLHKAAPGTYCKCGACKHLVLVTAGKLGLSSNQVKELLPPVTAKKVLVAPARKPLTGQVGTCATITVGSVQTTLAEGLVAMSELLNS